MKKIRILPILTITSLAMLSLPLVSCTKEEEEIEDKTPLYFEDIKDDDKFAKITYAIDGAPLDIDIEYKLDDGIWCDWTIGTYVTLGNGQRLYVRNTKNTLSRLNSFFKFVITDGDVNADGNVNSMINFANLTKACFTSMFAECENLKTPPKLPAKNLAKSCYQNMFCYSGITTAPELPATNLIDYCYTGMFSGCVDLKVAPELKSKNLAPHCYEQMFDICGITTAPVLPAEYLAEDCYSFMFSQCPLKDTPTLSSTHLAKRCYAYMFSNCHELVKTTNILPAINLEESCYDHMFAYCSELTSVPHIMGQLKLTENEVKCYEKMFKDCPKLNVQEDSESGSLIYSFNDKIDISLFANQMFSFEDPKLKRPWDDGSGNPRAGHSYSWTSK